MSFHWVDYAILFLIGLSILTGLIRGFVREIIALSVWVVAVWVAYTYSPDVNPWLTSYIKDNNVRTAASFILLMLATLVTGGLVSTALSFLLSKTPLKGTDRLLGMGFGLVRGTFIVAFLIGIINITSFAKESEFSNSHLYQRFKPISSWMFSFAPDFVEQVQQNSKSSTSKPALEPETELQTPTDEIEAWNAED